MASQQGPCVFVFGVRFIFHHPLCHSSFPSSLLKIHNGIKRTNPLNSVKYLFHVFLTCEYFELVIGSCISHSSYGVPSYKNAFFLVDVTNIFVLAFLCSMWCTWCSCGERSWYLFMCWSSSTSSMYYYRFCCVHVRLFVCCLGGLLLLLVIQLLIFFFFFFLPPPPLWISWFYLLLE